jgi:cytochrome c oxidase subunit I+III
MAGIAEPVAATRTVGQFEAVWTDPPGLMGHLRTINNVPVAKRYMVAAFAFFLVGGVQALLMRIQLGSPQNTFLDPETYNQLFTMHGTTMMFLFVIPFIEAIANYMLPVMLGTRDLPFPRLTALSFWTYVLGGIFLYSSFVVGAAPDAGWFAYVPLSDKEFSPGLNMDFWDIGLSVAEVAAMGAAAELIVAILRMRAAGMSLGRMPLFAWSMLVAAVMIIFAFTPLIVGTAMLELDRKGLTQFFDAERGGDPLLWQHIFWAFGHPEVYIMLIPATGIVSHVVQVFARRPVVGYWWIVSSMIAIGAVSFLLWLHHMFAAGESMAMMSFVAGASMAIAIPSGVQVFCWIATLWRGRPEWRVPLLFVIGFIVIFVAGGLTGVMVASIPFDLQVHDSHFVVAHFHYVLIGGVVFPLVAGIYYWLPKITGRLPNERLGRWNFWTMLVFFNVAFFPMHVAGLLGMPRRVYTYPSGLSWELPNLISTIGAVGFGAAVLLFVINVVWSSLRGERAGKNPWHADTLEWSEGSPVPAAQFYSLPGVRGRHPLWEQETLEPEDPAVARQLDRLEGAPVGWRGALVVSIRTARPVAIAHLPAQSIWPFVLSVGFTVLFVSALVEHLGLFLLSAAICVVATTGWFWPSSSEARAVREMGGVPDEGELPLAVGGRLGNGWWGMAVLVVILVVALLTIVASYFYLAARSDSWPSPDGTETLLAAIAASIALALAASIWWGTRTTSNTSEKPRGALLRRRWGLGSAMLFALLLLANLVLLYRYREAQFGQESAHESMVFLTLVFQFLVLAIALVMLAVAILWSWRAPADPRSPAAATNIGPLAYFIAASWLVVVGAIYVV